MTTQKSDRTPNIFLDVSGSMDRVRKRDIFSGVQRVVMTLGSELANILPAERLFITWYDRKKKRFVALPYENVAPDVLMNARAMRATFFPNEHRRKVKTDVLAAAHGRMRWYFQFRLSMAAFIGNDAFLARHGTTSDEWRASNPPPQNQPLSDVAQPGDYLLQLDLIHNPKRDAALAALRKIDMVNVVLVHDLIPIVLPQLVAATATEKFRDWLRTSLTYTDLYIANSHATERDLTAFFKTQGESRSVQVLPLAQAQVPIAGPQTQTAPIRRVKPPFVLCIGALEARKNNVRIAQAWKRLLASGHKEVPKLYFVGRVKEESAELLAYLAEHKKALQNKVDIIDSPSDADLDQLYKDCLFTIQASLYEGWGLPAGEALGYGKTGVLSNRSSLPEVGGDLVVYCDPEDVDDIARAVETLLNPQKRTELENKIAQTQLRDWPRVAQDLLTIVEKAR